MKKKFLCDICDNKYSSFLEYGSMPIANNYEKRNSNYRYNCIIGVCKKDKIFKNLNNINEKILFNNNYPYKSSVSKNFSEYLKKTANNLYQNFILKRIDSGKAFIIEVGSSDGVFLDEFRKKNILHLGIEPTLNNHLLAKKKGINSINKFLNFKISKYITKEYGNADLIFATNVIGHINNINETFKSINNLLKKDGFFIFENIYLSELIKNNSFDQLYDEHVYTLSVTSVLNICKKYKLNLFMVKKTNVQGGSMRYYISKDKFIKAHRSVQKFIDREKNILKFSKNTILKFYERNYLFKRKFRKMIQSLRNENKKIVGIGASAKSTFLINYCGFNNLDIDCIYDNSIDKPGKKLPGTNILIKKQLLFPREKFDYVIVFAWNHFEEIYKKYSSYKNMKKVKWIIPNNKIEIIE
mgnify:CR=1 FL=1|tara:strand:- start:11189 stop:12424 length:1236 start_codon:yes stop_codon:yes gene_type:complete